MLSAVLLVINAFLAGGCFGNALQTRKRRWLVISLFNLLCAAALALSLLARTEAA
ncbi:hypothetical protein [Brevundimonas sp. LPMIX5]|uniref:hypothetical protein n=1 Tax=Brevundimonas sp. LPMIX5 TaxID=2305887 RepID=UPI0013146915|nr:hypothetical protein [Brevundimonas sp. LPMIX5]